MVVFFSHFHIVNAPKLCAILGAVLLYDCVGNNAECSIYSGAHINASGFITVKGCGY